MTRDISAIVEAASGHRATWTAARFAQTLALLKAQLPGTVVDWEEHDEEWGRILSMDGSVGAYVYCTLPMVILDESVVRFGVITPPDVVRLEVPSMNAPCLRADKDQLEAALGRALSPNIDYDAFSADDLWWATV